MFLIVFLIVFRLRQEEHRTDHPGCLLSLAPGVSLFPQVFLVFQQVYWPCCGRREQCALVRPLLPAYCPRYHALPLWKRKLVIGALWVVLVLSQVLQTLRWVIVPEQVGWIRHFLVHLPVLGDSVGCA